MNYEIKFKKLSPDAVMPKRATKGAIAFDLYCPKDILVMPGRNIIPLDFAIELPLGYEAKIEPRSGFSAKGFEGYSVTRIDSTKGVHKKIESYRKEELKRMNADVLSGKVDCDYRGNVGVIVKNSDFTFICPAGSRIAQMTIYYSSPEWHFEETNELSSTEREDGGFGHTGTK